jgi:(2Fe-2S) ferredoxin
MAEPHFQKHVFICVNRRAPGDPKGDCASKGAEEVREAFKKLLHEKGLKGRIRANAAGCLDQCARGVTVVVYPEQTWYGGVKVEDVREIIDDHLFGGVPVERLRMK